METDTLSLTQKFEEALKDTTWGATIMFLDTLNSVEELDEIKPAMLASEYAESEPFYRDCLTRWVNPELSDEFKKRFPLLTARLDAPQKVRIFMRAARFRGVSVDFMGKVFEEVVRKREEEKLEKITYPIDVARGTEKGDALRIVYHTQIQAWTFNRLVLPGTTSC